MNAGAGSAMKHQLDVVRIERLPALIARPGPTHFRNMPAGRKAPIGCPMAEKHQVRLYTSG